MNKINKKGSMFDIVFIGFILLIGIVVAGMSIFLFNSVDEEGFFNESTETKYIGDMTEKTFKTFDYTLSFIYLVSILVAGILAYMLRNSVVFIIIYILIYIFLILIGYILKILFNAFLTSDQLGEVIIAHMPITTHLINNFIMYNLVAGAIIIVIMVAFSGGAESE